MEQKIPRRIRLDKMTAEERAIIDIVQQVENLGAHPLLTDVVILLGEARSKLADWVDRCTACDGYGWIDGQRCHECNEPELYDEPFSEGELSNDELDDEPEI